MDILFSIIRRQSIAFVSTAGNHYNIFYKLQAQVFSFPAVIYYNYVFWFCSPFETVQNQFTVAPAINF
ncbi:hypothetical protein RchiOBHm_Chr6g0253391 [Rosa chinensis]|uniref:Uncharacterized protein n=1 Tax=Rosa chinensis TaxID=74649 RepID=A0A2P6PLB3_ROSCH|nr:hypothetical protein RchiOBHm_Chr6g0253391 [Rosa chinensis]